MVGFLIKTFRSMAGRKGKPERMTIVVKRPYAYLKMKLQDVFEGQEDAEVVIDRRSAERRNGSNAVMNERRRGDRRESKEKIMEITIF